MANETYEVTERLGITEDGRAVPEGSVESRWLYAVPGRVLSIEEARRVGLVADDGFTAEDDETTVSLTDEGEAILTVEGEVAEESTEEAPAEESPVEDAPALDIPSETKRSRRRS